MTDKEARFLLGACRPNGADSTDPEFAEALAQAKRDPALKQWADDQHRFDSAMAARVQGLPVPQDLRTRILTGGRVSRPMVARRNGIWLPLAIAAMVALFAGLGFRYWAQPREESVGWEGRTLATLTGLLSGREKFDAQSPSVTDLEQWLRANGSPSPGDIPSALNRLSSLGCKTVSWNGHAISIICFHGPGGELVHLAMVARSALANPPPDGHPVFETKDGWRMACWSQGDTSMMLVTKAPESQLRSILGAAKTAGGPAQAAVCSVTTGVSAARG